MKITDIKLENLTVPLITPFKTALRTVNFIDDIVVKIKTDTGNIGLGEAAPTAVITGETKGSIVSAIENYIKPALLNNDITNMDYLINTLHKSILKNTSAKAAVDIALYDLYSQWLGKPLYKILGGSSNKIITDVTISLNEIDEMVRDSVIAVNNGFTILKIKLGDNMEKDIQRIIEIRKAVGENITIRIDANQGWSLKKTLKIIHKLEELDLNIELIEQPVPYYEIDSLKTITKNSTIKILADESVFNLRDAVYIITNGVADIINLKLMKTAGIYNAINIINFAKEYNVECMMGCMLESKISISAAAHLAAAKSNITMVDLDGVNLCRVDPIKGGAVFKKNEIILEEKAGIGFDIDK